MKKRVVSMFLSLVMTATLFSGLAFAEDAAAPLEAEEPAAGVEISEDEEFMLPPSDEIDEAIDADASDAEEVLDQVEDETEEAEDDLLVEEEEEVYTGTVTAEMVVAEARKYIGKPYVWGTQGPDSFDCSGLVWYIFEKKLGIKGLSQASSAYWNNPTKYGEKIAEKDALPGDLVSWDGHVGIYIGDGKYISALNSKDGVCISTVKNFRGTNPPHHYIRVKGVVYHKDEVAPEIKDVRVLSVSKSGYTVICTVTDDDSGVNRVQFPTWTTENGIDDMVSSWETNSAVTGSCTGDTYMFRVRVTDHKNELGIYNTNIYAYDNSGNSSYKHVSVTLKEDLDTPSVSYNTHMQTYAWTKEVVDGETGGVTGEGKRMEAVQIKLLGPDGKQLDPALGGIQYKTHCQTYGWMDWVADGKMAGTSGEAKRVEALQIKLTGEIAKKYDVYYRAHAQHYGWLGWAKNGQSSGTAGFAYRLEAIQIMLIAKGEPAPSATANAFYSTAGHTHDYVVEASGEPTCTENGYEDVSCYCGEKTKRTVAAKGHDYKVEVLEEATPTTQGTRKYTCKVCTDSYTEKFDYLTPHVTYYTHVQTYGDLKWVKDGELSGTTGEAKRLENIHVKLIDQDGKDIPPAKLGIAYRTHCQTYAWMPWSSNGGMSGTSGQAKRMEAIEIYLTGEMADNYDVYYCVHAQTYGWLAWAKNGETAGTSGLAKRLEALEIVLVEKGGTAPANFGTQTSSYIKN